MWPMEDCDVRSLNVKIHMCRYIRLIWLGHHLGLDWSTRCKFVIIVVIVIEHIIEVRLVVGRGFVIGAIAHLRICVDRRRCLRLCGMRHGDELVRGVPAVGPCRPKSGCRQWIASGGRETRLVELRDAS